MLTWLTSGAHYSCSLREPAPLAHLVRLGHSGMPHVARVSRVDVSARDAHLAHVTLRIPVVGRLTLLTLQNKTAVSGLRRRCADACTDEPC